MTYVQSSTHGLVAKQVAVKGSNMHYLEQGEGAPLLFLHGMPTSSYVWRHIMPRLADQARCIAPDLIGMGQSDHPDIEYRVFDHIAYMDEFIAQLGLQDLTLVLHGWGSVIGFDYARRHANNVKGVAFFESHIRPITAWDELSLPVQQMAAALQHPQACHRAIIQRNYLVDKLLPRSAVEALSPAIMERYRQPFPTPESRKPLWQYIQDLPLGSGPSDVVQLISRYSQWLEETPIPKLMLYAVPGFITTMSTVQWGRDHWSHLRMEVLEDVLHLAQESKPALFAEKLRDWYLRDLLISGDENNEG